MRACLFLAVTIFAAAGFSLPGHSAPAKRHPAPVGSANFPDDSISIVTEGSSEVSGRDGDPIRELAQTFAALDLPRVLPVAGLGPIGNARDLLHMRGIDLAVVDADIRAFAKFDTSLAGVGTRLAQVLKLYDKTVYVLGSKDIDSLQAIAGHKVLVLGEDSDGAVTARALFGLLGLPVSIESSSLADAVNALKADTAKAVLLVAGPGDTPFSRLPKDAGLHLLSVPPNPDLDAVYGRVALVAPAASGIASPPGGQTLTVATLLVTYTWRPNLYRYGPVQQFLRGLPEAIARLRQSANADYWRTIDASAAVPGWQVYDAAAPALARIARAEPAPEPPLPASPAAAAEEAPIPIALGPVPGGVDLVFVKLQGLAAPDAPGGGLLAELVTASFPHDTPRVEWSNDNVTAIKRLEGAGPARLAIGLKRPGCDSGKPLDPSDQYSCDRFLYSRPLFEALDVFFVRHGSDFTFERDEQVASRTICAANDTDIASLDAPEHRWLKQDLLTLLRRPTFADCLSAVDSGEVEAVFGDEVGGQAEIQRLGLTTRLEVVNRPVAVRELAAAVPKSAPMARELIERLNAGLAALKANGRYGEIVLSRLRPDARTAATSAALR